MIVAGYPSPTIAGAAHTFTITAKDAYGNTTPAYLGTVHFTSSDAQSTIGSGLPANYPFTVADAGIHTFSAALKTAGPQSVTASDTVIGTITGAQSDITVTPTVTASLVVGGYPSPTTAGAAQPFTVTAKDVYGNTTPAYLGTVHFIGSDAQSTIGNGLPANYPFTGAGGDSGVHTFTATLKTVGTQTLTATDTATGTITGTQPGIVVNPGAAATLTITGGPTTGTAGTPLALAVALKDAFGNVATDYTGTLHFTTSAALADLPANYAFTGTGGDNGAHTFSVTSHTTGAQTVTATDTLTGSITATQSLTITPALAALNFPAGPTAGGQTLTLTGDGFGADPSKVSVTFTSTSGTATGTVTGVTNTTVTVRTPAGDGAASVKVTVSGAASAPLANAYTFVVINPLPGRQPSGPSIPAAPAPAARPAPAGQALPDAPAPLPSGR